MFERFVKAAALGLLMLTGPMDASAGPITPGDFGGSAVVTTFDSLGLPFSNTGPLVLDGHTFTTNSGAFDYAAFFPTCFSNECIATPADLGFIDVVLGTPVLKVGAWLSSPNVNWDIRMDVFNAADALVGSLVISNALLVPTFGGWEDAGLIGRVRFTDLNTDGAPLVLDHFTVEAAAVPEPSTALLLATGLLGLAIAGRRKAL